MTPEKVSCLIIGSGPAGYTAAIYASRAGLNPVLYQGAQPGGQLTITTEVDNYPGYPDGITGPEMMVNFEKQAKRFGTDIRYGLATAVDFTTHPLKVTIDNKHEIEADSVIVSTGASAKWLGLPDEERLNGRGVSACAVCDGFFFRGQDVVVVGAGDTAAEEASYLAKLARKVYLLVRRDEMRASKIMQKRVEMLPNIEILWNTETVKLNGEEGLESVLVKNNKTGEEQLLQATGFFVAIGHKPNTDIFKGYLNMDETGYIQTIKGSACTNIKGVFACGDAQDNVYRQAITAAGTGCMAALDAERFLMELEVETIIEETA
ncbi:MULTISPECIES: thioredoxin-disulfide reductase [Dyadobacter]|uniref:Thioredoxin reductase n=1 Tax=Dyadobacter chenhuakuii TaxID=2909339 RepID=A0A9X1TSQ2_9BACT|nr:MULTISPECIES: thioredoxin-disulfide reductase [Dyadobacter]MCE7070730.1 thioredoxin-disulfide reductase [Dyadobacter sp. CY327]MCF2494352.1 thioredoxin-disulfide reductase [Dyadobacter chenhuakuii]MCF2498295.1 thioredoxin-disulfide reductase [Dyadobacter chenhuakuii]MCF2518621.1 thioredoxin-disulfide reductase [Dyadobacter sp. CY351]USJ31474.1 thioredoxin-disulfide reductase [Dyadobacter chenhuakuii]